MYYKFEDFLSSLAEVVACRGNYLQTFTISDGEIIVSFVVSKDFAPEGVRLVNLMETLGASTRICRTGMDGKFNCEVNLRKCPPCPSSDKGDKYGVFTQHICRKFWFCPYTIEVELYRDAIEIFLFFDCDSKPVFLSKRITQNFERLGVDYSMSTRTGLYRYQGREEETAIVITIY